MRNTCTRSDWCGSDPSLHQVRLGAAAAADRLGQVHQGLLPEEADPGLGVPPHRRQHPAEEDGPAVRMLARAEPGDSSEFFSKFVPISISSQMVLWTIVPLDDTRTQN